jgi:penicillin-binding protein 1A
MVLDAPIEFIDHDKIWRPQNYSRKYYGPTTVRRALEQSQNVVTIRIVQDLGVGNVAKYVNAHFGFTRPVGRNLSIGLGTSEVTPLELASAYSAFANSGRRAEPVFITRIEDSDGNLLEQNAGKITDTISPQTAYLITSLLEGVVQNGTGRAARALDRPVAGKTGTTNEQVDAWFVGYTPDLLAAVWIGYDDNRTLGPKSTGGHIAAPLWVRFMQKALAGHPVTDFEMPDGIRCVNIDPETGLRARADNMKAYLECFKDGSEPQQFTPLWRYDPDQGTEVLAPDGVNAPPQPSPVVPDGAGMPPADADAALPTATGGAAAPLPPSMPAPRPAATPDASGASPVAAPLGGDSPSPPPGQIFQ